MNSGNILDRTIAQSMINEDFLKAKIRREDPNADRLLLKPRSKETPWGKFPNEVVKNTGAKSKYRGTVSERPKSACANYSSRVEQQAELKYRRQEQTFSLYGSNLRPQSASQAQRKPSKKEMKEAEDLEKEAQELKQFMSTRGRFRSNPRKLLEDVLDSKAAREEQPANERKSEFKQTRGAQRSAIKSGSATFEAKNMGRTAFGVLGEKYERPLSAGAIGKGRRSLGDPGPGKAGAFRYRQIEDSLFRKYYDRGDLPVVIEHRPSGNTTRWTRNLFELDYHIYLPIFFDGLREVDDPYRFLSIQGTLDMILVAPEKVLPVVPQIILPLKAALNTRHPGIICPVLKVLQQMIVQNPLIGQALVPYYRQLLPVFNLLKNKESNLGHDIAYDQRARNNVGELIRETLELMEVHGGPDAFINIKYMVPTYESCCL